MMSDHSTDQQKLAGLVEQLKVECDRRVRGKQALAKLSSDELRVFLLKGLERSYVALYQSRHHKLSYT